MRIALIIGIWLVALTAGALLYIAKQKAESGMPAVESSAVAADAATSSDPNDATVSIVEPTANAGNDGPLDFTLPAIDGTPTAFSTWDGKHRILNFWATWCAPCRREIPLLKDFQDAQAGNDIQVIGVAVDFPEDVSRYADAAEFNYPVVVGQEDAMAIAETSGVPFIGLPFTMIVGRDGRLIDTHMGEIFEEDLELLVDTLNKLDAGEISVEQAREVL